MTQTFVQFADLVAEFSLGLKLEVDNGHLVNGVFLLGFQLFYLFVQGGDSIVEGVQDFGDKLPEVGFHLHRCFHLH